MGQININEQIRDIISKWVEEGANNSLNTVQSIEAQLPHFYSLGYKDIFNCVGINILLSVGYLDAYKLYSYKQKECTNNDEEEELLGALYDIESYSELYKAVCSNPDMLVKILCASSDFNDMSELGKIMIVKSLTPSENEWLQKKFPHHKQDITRYDKEVTIDLLIENYKDRKNHQEKIIMVHFKEALIMSIGGFIRNLIKIDKDNAIELLLEIGKIDYAASKYLLDKISDEQDIFNDHIDYYENFDIDSIISRLMYDIEFLKDAIWMLIAVYVDLEYCNISLSKEIISDEDTDKIAKKLVLQ